MDTSYAVSDDRDLGGDDLKLVEYRIYFDKFDQEAFLRDGKELLNYRSTEADFGGRVIADFLHEVSPNGRPGKEEEVKWAELPYAWRVKKHEMFPTVQSLWDTNRKYLRMTYRVIDRWPRQDREYDKSMSESLAQIALNTTPREHSERERAEKERDNKDRK